MTALAILVHYWRQIGVAALCVVILSLLLLDAHHVRQRDAARASASREKASHAVTLQSVADLSNALAAKNAESEARAKAFDASKVADAKAVAAADARYRSTQARVDALTRMARDLPADHACRVPAALLANLEGL